MKSKISTPNDLKPGDILRVYCDDDAVNIYYDNGGWSTIKKSDLYVVVFIERYTVDLLSQKVGKNAYGFDIDRINQIFELVK